MNMHPPTMEGNFSDDHGKAMKPAIIQECNRHMGYVDESDRMTDYYCVSRWTWKRTKKLFFQIWTLPFSTALSFVPLVFQNYYPDNSDRHW
jgi:hypothetical protein